MNFDFSMIPTATLAAMMVALGMELHVQDFVRLMQSPRAAFLGVLAQLVFLPAIALVLALCLPIGEATAVGLMLLAACPGGTTSNMFSSYARGDVALSISLTAVSGLLAPLTVPIVLGLGFTLIAGTNTPIQVSLQQMVVTLVFTTAVPVLIGMAILHFRPTLAEKVRGRLLGIATGAMVLLLVGLLVNTARVQPDIAGLFTRSSLAVVLLIVSCVMLATVAARLLRVPHRQERTLILEVGIQNVNLALVVAFSFLKDTQYLGPALVYMPFMFVLAALVIYRAQKVVD